MELQQVFATASAIIVSVGGSGAIICAVSDFLSTRIANRIEVKYQQRLEKELEEYKTWLENKRYITQAQFNVEFEIYRKLSKAFFELLVKLSTISEKEFYENNIHELEKLEHEKNIYCKMVEAASNAQNILFENSPFIPQNIYQKYDELYEMFNKQFWIYHERCKAYLEEKIESVDRFDENDKKKFEEIQRKLFEINSDVRSYLGTLAIK